MDSDPRQSIHEIGLARQLVFSAGRAALVTVGSPSQEDSASQPETLSDEVGQRHDVGGDDSQKKAEQGAVGSLDFSLRMGLGNVASYGSRGRGGGPRVVYVADDGDWWSTFANPDCLHDWDCGHTHKARPRIQFMPNGVSSGQRVSGSASSTAGTKLPSSNASYAPTPTSDSLLGQDRDDMESTANVELPSKIGPFVLESLSSKDSVADGPRDSELTSATAATSKKSPRTLRKEYYATRTEDWVVNLPPEACTVPYQVPPLASPETSQTTNPENMGISHRVRHQDSAIRGNFIPLSKSFKAQTPLPPRHEEEPRGVYLELSLTDSQMDRLTAVLSSADSDEPLPRGRARTVDREPDIMNRPHNEDTAARMRSRSPAKAYESTNASRARSRSPVKFNLAKTPESQRTLQGFQGSTASASPNKSREPRFERDTPTTYGTPRRIGGRRVRGPPAPIDTELARTHARLAALRVGKQPAVVVQNPPERAPSPSRRPSQHPAGDDSSSYYSQDSAGEPYPSCISPLRIHKENEPKHLSILQEYIDQKNSVRGSDKASEDHDHHGTPDEASSSADQAYTPLAPFTTQPGLAVRKASKTLIGEGGWLENTSKRDPAASPTRAGGFLGNLVKKAKEMIEANQDTRAQRKSRESDKTRPASRQLAISLSPREQSLLYCELDFALTTALNDYITTQFAAGRLEADRLKKIAEDWQRKGRPKVVGFRYDMETQLDLVRLHVNDFMFYSRLASATAILGVIDTAKASARVMRVRTFCQPDTVIAKQLLDAQGLFNILGCPEDQQIKLAEIIAFFKAAVERARVQALRERGMHQQQQHLQQHQQGHQQQVEGVGASASAATVAAAAAAATSPVRNNRSPTRQGEDWWGTTAAATAAASTMGPLKRSKSHGAGQMDPAGYDSQEE